jgi:hypothetical protein
MNPKKLEKAKAKIIEFLNPIHKFKNEIGVYYHQTRNVLLFYEKDRALNYLTEVKPIYSLNTITMEPFMASPLQIDIGYDLKKLLKEALTSV